MTKQRVDIWFRDNSDGTYLADKVELLPGAPSVLSVICGCVNMCIPVDRIAYYQIEEVGVTP